MLNRPAIGVIKQPSKTSVVSVKAAVSKKLATDYFQLTYPGRYELQESSSPLSWVLVAHQALGLGQASKIAVAIEQQATGGVKESSAYKHAEAFPVYYEISLADYANEPVTILSRTNPSFEKTILWPHGGLVLTISLTSAEKTDNLASESNSILESLTWQ